jgi:hypothetical protein
VNSGPAFVCAQADLGDLSFVGILVMLSAVELRPAFVCAQADLGYLSHVGTLVMGERVSGLIGER